MPSAHKDLDVYRTKLGRARNPVTCRHCGESVLPKLFEKHVSEVHHFNAKLNCVWCEEKSWNSSEKHSNALHLIECFEKIYQTTRLPTPPPSLPIQPSIPLQPEVFKLLTLRHLFPEKDHFGAVALLIHTLYEFICPLAVVIKPLFQDDNLNLAAAYVVKYLETRETHEWFHVMVKAVTMPSFVGTLNRDRGKTRTILFSCWCDGGHYEHPMHRQHRHMIVVSPKGHFEKNIWEKVDIEKEDRPHPYYPCKSMRRIKSPMHLVNTLGYVSHRKLGCQFASEETPDKLHHFYIYKTLPEDFRLPLALLWEGGLQELLYDRKFRNVSITRLIEKPVVSVNGQWKQKIKHFYGHESGLVVPVSKGLMPAREVEKEAPLYTFHLLEGDKLYFYHSQEIESLDEETWLRKQAEGGNCFYNNVEEAMWTMRPYYQRMLSIIMPLMEKGEKLESENTRLKEDLEISERSHRATLDNMERKCEEKMVKLKRRHEKAIAKIKDSTKKKIARMKENYERCTEY